MPPTTPTLLASISRLPWLPAAWLANGWLLLHGPHQQAILKGWLWSAEQICFVEFIKDFFLLFFFFLCFFKNQDNSIGILHTAPAFAKLTSNLKIFDKCPAWFSHEHLIHTGLFCTCSVISAAVLCSCRAHRAQCVWVWVCRPTHDKCDFCNWMPHLWSNLNSAAGDVEWFCASWEKHPVCFLHSCETHSHSSPQGYFATLSLSPTNHLGHTKLIMH